jgi:HlyD family secretion protein
MKWKLLSVRSKSVWTVGILAVVIVGGVAFRGPIGAVLNPTVQGSSAVLYTLREQPFRSTVYSIGELKAARSSTISTPFNGKIIKLVPEGTRVEVGDPVVWFETEEIESELQTKESQLKLDEKNLQSAQEALVLEEKRNELNLQSERIQVDIARQGYEDAKQKFESEQILFERNITPQTKLDEARLRMLQEELSLRNSQINLAKVEENLAGNLRVKQSDIEKARIELERTQRELEEAREQMESAILKATNPGDIAYLKIWKNGTVGKVAEGDQVWRNRTLVEIPDTTQMLASVPVSEIDIGRVELGQPATITVEAIPGKTFSGVVETKSSVPITDDSQRSWGSGTTNGPREFEVVVKLDSVDPLMRQGMTASVEILIDELPNAVPVPLEALVEFENSKGVHVETAMGSEFNAVEVERSNERFALLRSPLPVGTEVLLNPAAPKNSSNEVVAQEISPLPEAQTTTPNSSPKAPI